MMVLKQHGSSSAQICGLEAGVVPGLSAIQGSLVVPTRMHQDRADDQER